MLIYGINDLIEEDMIFLKQDSFLRTVFAGLGEKE